MTKHRLEAFSDAVIAIIITIMVLELAPPAGTSFSDLLSLGPKFLTYFLSFLFLAIYWNNHHHLFHPVKRIDGSVLWANMLLLLWLSLIPFATAWAGDAPGSAIPVATYGAVLLLAALALNLLVRRLLAIHEADSALSRAIGRDTKGRASLLAYAVAIPLSFVTTTIGWGLYLAVALLWFVPDPRIEKAISS